MGNKYHPKLARVATFSYSKDHHVTKRPENGAQSPTVSSQEVSRQFSPRLDPLARRLRLTCTGTAAQIMIDLELDLDRDLAG
jgi:hypothetical protein